MYALSVSDSGIGAILCFSILMHLTVSSSPFLSGESIWCHCAIGHEFLQQRDVTRQPGFLFGLLGEIITMKTDWMEGEMEEILKGMAWVR